MWTITIVDNIDHNNTITNHNSNNNNNNNNNINNKHSNNFYHNSTKMIANDDDDTNTNVYDEQQYILYFMSILLVSFWVVIWAMHICALTNAKLKLNKKSFLSAANKKKTKRSSSPPSYNKLFNINNINAKSSSSLPITSSDYNTIDLDRTVRTTSNADTYTDDNNDDNSYFVQTVDSKQTSTTSTETSTTTSILNNYTTIKNSVGINQSNIQNQTTNNHYSYIILPLPGVSIIKPLVGIDKNLYYNLESFFLLEYPHYEILFCVQDPDDEGAILVVEELLNKYPHVDARLFIGGSRVGVNPKINNMQPAYEAMKYELVLISDSGILMKQDTLLDMVSHMQDDVALVHQMPFVNCHGRNNFQSVVERVYFGTAHARAYLTADLLNINCPTGMSALMRKCLLDEVGGIKAFGQYLAEDYFFAKSFTDRGWKICISSQPALQNSANSSDTLSALNSRIQRWIKLRFAMVPQWTLLEPFSECILLGILGALSISFIWSISPYAVFIFHLVLWYSLDYTLLCTIQDGPLTCSQLEFLLAWLLRECTALIIFIRALTNSKVTWRTRTFKIKWGGFTEEVLSDKQVVIDGGADEGVSAKNDSAPSSKKTMITSKITATKNEIPSLSHQPQSISSDHPRNPPQPTRFPTSQQLQPPPKPIMISPSPRCGDNVCKPINQTNNIIPADLSHYQFLD